MLLKDRAHRVQAGDSNEVADDETSKLILNGPLAPKSSFPLTEM